MARDDGDDGLNAIPLGVMGFILRCYLNPINATYTFYYFCVG